MAAVTAPWAKPVARSVVVAALLLCGLPVATLILSLIQGDWSPSQAVLQSLPRTILLTSAAALVCGAIGVVLGFACLRLPSTGRLPLLLVLSVPALLPTYVLALAWSVWLVPALPLGQGALSSLMEGSLPTLWVWAAALYPLPLWATFIALRRWNAAWSEAASSLGLSPIATVGLRVRYLFAPVGSAVLLVWLLLLSDFAVPDYFRFSVYGTEAFIEVASYGNVRGALIASLPCVAIALVVMFGFARLWQRWQLTADAAARPSDEHLETQRWRGAASIVLLGAAVLVVVPMSGIITTAAAYDSFLALWPAIWPDALLSAGIALAVVAVAVPLAVLVGYFTQRGIWGHSGTIRAVLAATFAVPGALLGLAGIALWNQPSTVGLVYTSGAALVLLLVARWLPLAQELQHYAVRSVPTALEEAAWTQGVPWRSSFPGILLRLSSPAIIATTLLIFVMVFNDLTLAALLAPPGWSTLPLRLFSTVHYGSASTLAAICTWQLLFLLVPLASLAWLGRRKIARL